MILLFIIIINLMELNTGSLRNTQAPICVIKKEGKKDMLYLTMHSTHFIYGYMASGMVKDHSDSEKGNSPPPHGQLFPISSKASFI